MTLVRTALFSFLAGFVDTVGFIALFGLFTAHVTGNFVMLGASLSGDAVGAAAKILALPVFVLTVAAVTIAVRQAEARGRSVLRSVYGTQLAFLTAFMTAGALTAPFASPDSGEALLVGMAGVIAMAIQNAASRLGEAASTPSTVMTGNVTQAVIDAVDLMRAKGEAGTARKRLKGLAVAVTAFAAGAIGGALGYIEAGLWCLAVPVTLLAGLLMMPVSAAATAKPAG